MLQGFVILGHLLRLQRLGCIRLPGSLTPCFTVLAFCLCALCSVLLPVSLVQLCSHVFPFITIIQCISALSFPNFFVSSWSVPRVCFQSSSVTQFSSSCPYNIHRACSQLACESCVWSFHSNTPERDRPDVSAMHESRCFCLGEQIKNQLNDFNLTTSDMARASLLPQRHSSEPTSPLQPSFLLYYLLHRNRYSNCCFMIWTRHCIILSTHSLTHILFYFMM